MNEFSTKRTSADLVFVNQGITFSVYSDRRGVEKIFPFDLIPRTIPAAEWADLEAGLVQRIKALNLFLHDVYHDQRILNEKVIPADLVLGSKGFRKEMVGFTPPGGQYIHVCGTDLIRDADGQFLVLEDNGRTPVGRQLRARKPRRDEEGVPAAVRGHAGSAASRTTRTGCARPSASVAPGPRAATRRAWCCCRRGRTTRPTSSTASWPGTWASSWCSARTCSSTTTWST